MKDQKKPELIIFEKFMNEILINKDQISLNLNKSEKFYKQIKIFAKKNKKIFVNTLFDRSDVEDDDYLKDICLKNINYFKKIRKLRKKKNQSN